MIELLADPDAEMAILGAAMLLPSVMERVTNTLQEADFYRDGNTMIFAAMRTIAARGEPVDFVTLTGELSSRGILDQCGGRDYLYRIAEVPGSVANVEAYARRVAELAQRRRIIEAGYCAIGAAQNLQLPLSDVRAQSESAILANDRSRADGAVPLHADLPGVIDAIMRRRRERRPLAGISSGLAAWDWYLGGLQKSHLLIIAARPAMGKTAAMVDVAINAGRAGASVLIYSLEMSRAQIQERMLSSEAGINGRQLRTGDITDSQVEELHRAQARLSKMAIAIDDARGMTPGQMTSGARRIRSTTGRLDLVAVDYLQIARPDERRNNRQGWEEIGAVAVGLKDMARSLDIPVLALAQLNRQVETRANKRPIMSDLGESAKIEHEADSITFLYRPAYYDESPGTTGPMEREEAEWIVGKNRHGETGIARLSYAPAITRFDNLAQGRR